MDNESLQNAVTRYSSTTAQCTAALLRVLSSWAFVNGWVKNGVALGISLARRSPSTSTKGLAPGEVAALKDAGDFDGVTARRETTKIIMLTPESAGSLSVPCFSSR